MLLLFWNPVGWILCITDGFRLNSLLLRAAKPMDDEAEFLFKQEKQEVSPELLVDPSELKKEDKVLGRGGFGVVYKAIWHGQIVAVKQIQEAMMELDENWKQSFLSEMKMMARLRHPNIVQLLGVCVNPYSLITEYMENGALHNLLRRSEVVINPSLKLRMATDAARGMAYLHSRNVIHRDFKSPNILVDANFTTKVAFRDQSSSGYQKDND